MRGWASLFVVVAASLAALLSCGHRTPPPVFIPPPLPESEAPKHWHTFRHDNMRTGRGGYAGPTSPKVLYSIPVPWSTEFSDPVFDEEGDAYVPTDNGLRIYRGEEVVWELDLGEYAGVFEAVVLPDQSFLVQSLPEAGIRKYSEDREVVWENADHYPYYHITVSEDGCIAFTDVGLVGMSPEGQLLWEIGETEFFQFPMAMAAAWDGNFILGPSSPMTLQGQTSALAKVNSQTGEVIWETAMPDTGGAWFWDSPTPVIAADGTIYLVDNVGIHAFGDDGKIEWSYYPEEIPGAPGVNPTPWTQWLPAVGPDGTVYVCLMEEVETYATAIIALAPDGELKWRRDEYVEGSPIVDAEGTLYVGKGYGEPGVPPADAYGASQVPEPMEPDNTILAINPDGSTKWVFSSPDEIEVGQVLCMDNGGNLVVRGAVPGADGESFLWIGDG